MTLVTGRVRLTLCAIAGAWLIAFPAAAQPPVTVTSANPPSDAGRVGSGRVLLVGETQRTIGGVASAGQVYVYRIVQ